MSVIETKEVIVLYVVQQKPKLKKYYFIKKQ